MESHKPRRQEQESAREEVTEVGKDVLRMELPISMPGLGHVNCYALVDGEGAALVDPGLPTASSFAALRSRLSQAGLAVKDCHTVIVTHSHPDHFGGASRVLDESGGKLVAHNSFHLGMGAPEKPEVSVDDLHAHGFSCFDGALRISRRRRLALAAGAWLGLPSSRRTSPVITTDRWTPRGRR